MRDLVVSIDFTVFQLLGFLTVFFALVNIFLYGYVVYMLWSTTHTITKTLRDKIIIEALLTFTTVMMGVGALLETSKEWWFISYTCRVGLLFISPFVIYKLVKACYVIAHTEQEKDDGKSSS